jgi:hypothetical protein
VAAAAMAKEEDWSYTPPKFDEPPSTVAIDLLPVDWSSRYESHSRP